MSGLEREFATASFPTSRHNASRRSAYGSRWAPTAGDVVRFILQDSIRLIALGTALGLAAALLAGRVLLKVVVGMQSTEPATVAAMVALLVAAALAASF